MTTLPMPRLAAAPRERSLARSSVTLAVNWAAVLMVLALGVGVAGVSVAMFLLAVWAGWLALGVLGFASLAYLAVVADGGVRGGDGGS